MANESRIASDWLSETGITPWKGMSREHLITIITAWQKNPDDPENQADFIAADPGTLADQMLEIINH